jgi:hypothetical protein
VLITGHRPELLPVGAAHQTLKPLGERPLLAQSGRLHIGRYLTAIDGAKRTLQSLRPSFSVGWNLLAARYSY